MPRYPAETFTLSAPNVATQGSSIDVTVNGPESGEKVTISVGGKQVPATLSGRPTFAIFSKLMSWRRPTARAAGQKFSVNLAKVPLGTHDLVATGQSANRTGSEPIEIVPPAKAETMTKRI